MRLVSLALLLAGLATAHAVTLELKPGTAIPDLAAARDAARQAHAANAKEPITVQVAEGTYPITEPIVFEPQDSGVTYEAAPGAKPVFTGGKKITGWKVGADGVWTTQVGPGTSFEVLWVNGRRATRARTPKGDYIQATGQPLTGLPGIPLNGSPQQTMLQIAPKDAEILRGLSAEELHDVNVVVLHSWNETRHRIAGVRFEDGTLQFTGGVRNFFSLEPFHRLYFENLRAALTDPGDWFLARNGTLSYKPRVGEKPETADAWAPVATQWLLFKGDPAKDDALVHDVHFRGLSFQHQAYTLPETGVGFHQAEEPLGAAIEADGLRNVSFEQCEFAHTMTNTLWLRRGCRDITLRQCWLHDLGAGGVKIGESKIPSEQDQTSFVTIDNCIIHTGGRYFLSAIGVLIFHASDCTVRHCDIADFYYSAISIGWVWGYKPTPCARNLVEDCHLHHLGWAVLSDMGAVYTLGPQPGTAIRGCHIHDIGVGSYGGWGMYNDEGSTGIVWENNLVHHTQDAGYHQHYGRGNIVRNNIIAYGAEEHIRWSRPEEFFAFAFEHNIVLMGEGRLFAHIDKSWDTGHVFLANNVYWKPDGPIPEFAGKTWADWQFLGRDTGSIVADPLFVAPEKGDWTLRPESPALKVGFVPFDWKKAGVTGEAPWRQLAAEEFPPMKYGLKPKTPPLTLHDGFETTPVGGPPARAKVSTTKKPGLIKVVAGQAAKGDRCLQLTDGPDVEPAFEPHFYYAPGHDHGLTRTAFDVRAEPDYQLVFEWRDDATPYHTGPRLSFGKNGIRANDKTLAEFPTNTWVHVEVTAKLGPDSDATWNCTLTFPGKEPQHFDGLKFDKADMKILKWLGFSSPGRVAAKCWLDEIEIENKPAK
ncbi:MAG: right-handed parallel beta-helix repeat-containing protein [Chthoniobacter sp.]|nr:right-handed parallel beta-helix repeat-containing protein [Chthoniobacter sp.]